MSEDAVLEFRSAERALKVVKAAERSGMKPAEIAVALDVSESTIRMWRSKPDAIIAAPTARKARRLERRLKNGRSE